MASYRLYFLDRHSGHIDSVDDFPCADDVGAICLVQERHLAVPAELWCRGRKVCRFDAKPEIGAYAPVGVGALV